MQSDEQRRARMRAYYRRNKAKWQKYKEERLARLSDEQLAELQNRQREYYCRYYQSRRIEIAARVKSYRASRRAEHAAYQATYFQQNKATIASKRKRHYHEVVKPRIVVAKQGSEYVGIREAVEILGASKLRTFREWVYQGRIASVRTPGGKYLLRRKYIEELKESIQHLPAKMRRQLGLEARREGQ